MRILLTNDDGIDAPGIGALYEAARGLGNCTVVAPALPQSGCSHTVTTGVAVRYEERSPEAVVIHGTPADCVRLGLMRLDPKPECILSGINHGGNLGADVYYSGTVAAVREGVLHGWPGIALSQYKKKHLDYDWPRATVWVVAVLQKLLSQPIPPGAFWNVNLPHLASGEPEPNIVEAPLDPNPLPLSFIHGEEGMQYNGDYHNRQRLPGSDVDVCFGGNIAVTLVRLL
jgi:5'-nucleotidase